MRAGARPGGFGWGGRRAPARDQSFAAGGDAAGPERVGRVGRHRRRGLRLLLGSSGDRGRCRNPRFRRAQAFRHGAGELWVGGPLPHARHHRRRSRLRGVPAGCSLRRPERNRSLSGALRSRGRQARRRRFCRTAIVAVRNGSSCLRPRWAPGAPRYDGARRDLARAQVRRRPDGSGEPDGSGGRSRRAGDLLLPELRPRDGRGEWLDPPDDQLGKAGQHHRRLWLPAGFGEPRALRRLGRRGTGAVVPILLRCHKGIGPAVSGTALVATDNFSARYDLDRERGIFSRPTHKLAGQSYADRVLVFDTAKGGVATAWMLHDMAARCIVPQALIFNRVNPILAQGAAFGGVALVDRFEGDVTQLLRTGDELRVDPSAGLVEILNRDR